MATNKDGEPIKSDDDNHITVRLGTGPNVFNLHGHFYLIHEGNSLKNRAVRMMEEHERSIVGGRNPQLLVWGDYPKGSRSSTIKFPKPPFEIKAGSILDMKIQEENEEDERLAAAKRLAQAQAGRTSF